MIQATNQPPPRRAAGLTLAELIIGLLLLAIIGGATAAVAAAISRGWQLGEAEHASSMTITRTMLRIQDKIHRAKAIGQFRAGSVDAPDSAPGAALLFWREDADGDGRMQLDETQLLEFVPATKELVVHEIVFPDPVTRAANNGPFNSSTLSDPDAIEDYKAMEYKALPYAITRNVLGAAFNVITPSSPSQRPQFEFRLRFDAANGQTVQYGTASPRAPIN